MCFIGIFWNTSSNCNTFINFLNKFCILFGGKMYIGDWPTLRRGQRTTPDCATGSKAQVHNGFRLALPASPQPCPLHSARGAFLVPACHQSLGHLLTDNTLSTVSFPGLKEERSMRIYIFSFGCRNWSLTHKLGNLPVLHREIIQFGGPQESLPTALPKVHPGLSNCPASLKICWHARALDCHQTTFPQTHYTFLVPRAATRNKLWSSGLFHHDLTASLFPPGWSLSWSVIPDPLIFWLSGFLTPWPPDTQFSACLPLLFAFLVHIYAYITLHCIHLLHLCLEAPWKQRLYSMYNSKA